jgi:HTH-type transcriptional regulator/antitoxin HigA
MIKTEAENEQALAIVEDLMHRERTPEEDELYQLLIILIEKFEQEYYRPNQHNNSVSMLLFLLEESDQTPKDLVMVLGNENIVNNIFNGLEKINAEQANLRTITLKQTNLDEDQQEDVMNLSTAYLEWEQKTLEQGEKRGEIKGELKGELKGQQKLIIRQLNRRLGEINPPLIEQIRQLPVEQLEELAEALLDFSTVAHLQQWLNSRPKPAEQE